MAASPALLYENHLKGAYSVPGGGKVLAITDNSCYTLAEETAWLTGRIPAIGSREEYLDAMSGLGIAAPARIFDRLLAIGALRTKKKRSLGGLFRSFISPKIKLLPARVQEKAFGLLGASPGGFDKASARSRGRNLTRRDPGLPHPRLIR
ncbi:MAG TPA: hypothetical protein PK523_00155 [Elusimicrobiales bacterium]|nr:hypothetical protein [Elusimicrobiales bacterium]